MLIASPTPQPRWAVSSGELVVHLIDSAGDGSHKAAGRRPQTLANERRSGSTPADRPLGRAQGTLRSKTFWESPVLHQAGPVRREPSRPARTVETHEFDRVSARCDPRCDETGETTNPHLHGTPKEQGRFGHVVFCWEAGHTRHGNEPMVDEMQKALEGQLKGGPHATRALGLSSSIGMTSSLGRSACSPAESDRNVQSPRPRQDRANATNRPY